MPGVGDAPIAKRLGPYTLGRKLGAGGMATVYAARADGAPPGELIALKVLSAELAGDGGDQHRAFLREAAIATRLVHPNIVRTFHVGDHDGRLVLAMELVHGVSLGKLQKTAPGPLPLDVALRIATDVARALHAAHELADPARGPLGLVHQDVSPHNILVGYDGVTKLVDFGVARLASIDGTRTESLKGKPSYASPEQVDGKHIDRRTDVFALGVVLWEMLTGARLFRRDTSPATYVAVLKAPIPDVRELVPTVPEAVARVTARALDRDREARYPTAEALRAALDEARGLDIPEASDEEIAIWVARLVAPELAFPELRRELDEVTAVPDLEVPAPSRRAAPAPAPPRSTPAAAAAPVDTGIDELDMEIERDGAMAALASMQSATSVRAPIVASTATGLEVAHTRPVGAPRRAAFDDDEPSPLARALAFAAAVVVAGGAAAALVKLAHRAGGRAIAAMLPHAFDATSALQSGIVSGVLLVLSIGLGFAGLRLRPRSWAMVVSGGAMLLASLAMVTVTLLSTEENPGDVDGVLVIPYLVPLATFALALGVAGRAARLFAREGAASKLAAVPAAAIAGALAFLAIETSPLAGLF